MQARTSRLLMPMAAQVRLQLSRCQCTSVFSTQKEHKLKQQIRKVALRHCQDARLMLWHVNTEIQAEPFPEALG